MGGFLANALFAQDISPAVLQQIAEITTLKQSFTAAQRKIESALVFSALAGRNQLANSTLLNLVAAQGGSDINASVSVDIRGVATPALLNAIASAGGTVESSGWGMIRASIPLGSLETVALNSDVKSIQKAALRRTNGNFAGMRRAPRTSAGPGSMVRRSGVDFVGALTSQGYVAHSANTEVGQGFNGSGVTVGVLSDSASATRIAALIASGDLPANTMVLPGQVGPASGEDEGTAMMEIIHDMAPGANLIFATAFTSENSFASNIIALQQAGCKVIVDDVSYSDEGAFQDGPVAQAVNQVTASGTIYFSAAANSGNLDSGTSGTWEGDFQANGAGAGILAGKGTLHNFGTAASPQNYDVLTAATSDINLKWSDPLGGSTNDYDLYLLNSTGTTIIQASTTTQNGTGDPFEEVYLNSGSFAAGDRIVVVQVSGAPRALRIDTSRGTLSIATAGSTFGHNAGLNTVSTAATYWNSAKTGTRPFTGSPNPVERFSSDGPRKIFYNANGTAITAGNFLFGTNGGTTLQKPDLTAADGISTKTPGFLPFFGTSAAAPHAAAIAALVLQAKPSYTPAQVKAAMTAGTVDNMAPGVDRDSGYGIVMAPLAVQYAVSH